MTAKRSTQLTHAGPTKLFIQGHWRESSTGDRFTVFDPSTGRPLTTVSDASIDDAKSALNAACGALAAWSGQPPRRRSDVLLGAYRLLIERRDDFAARITSEMGKSLEESKAEVDYAASFLLWFSEEAVRISGQFRQAPASGMLHVTERHAVGPCLLITPWNFPLAMAARKIGPALAAGCTCVVKPSEVTPLTTLKFSELLAEAGVPPGVVNVVTTTNAPQVVGYLLSDKRLRKVSFTGSTKVGREILSRSSNGILRTSMELGGNAPFIVLDDADLDAAIEGAIHAKLRNIGQACTAANRFIVHEAISKQFVSRLAEQFRLYKVGPSSTGQGFLGPMITEDARLRVHQAVAEAVSDGAELLAGGRIPDGEGYFYPPTLLSGATTEMKVFREEIFGSVAPVHIVSDMDHAVRVANATDSGLAGYLFTGSLDSAFAIRSQLEVGMLGINTGLVSDAAAPFGGVKQSGLGREGGAEGIEEYLYVHFAALSITEPTTATMLQPAEASILSVEND